MASQAQIDQARAEGYSDAEISQHLLSQPGVDEARAEGYSDQEILSHFGFAPQAAGWGAAPALLTGATFGQFPKLAAEGFALAGRGDYASNLAKFESARSAYGKENPLTATGLEIAGSIPSSLAAMALVPEMAAPAMFGRFAPLASRVTTQGIRGGVAGTATSQIPAESGARDLAEGYVAGSALGAAFPLAGAVIAPAVAPAVASAVRAAEGLGVKLRPGQFAASRVMSKLDDLFVNPSHTDQQLRDVSKAAAEAIGEKSISASTVLDANARIGQGFDNFAQQARFQYTPQLNSKLNSIISEMNPTTNRAGRQVALPGVYKGVEQSDRQAILDVIEDIKEQAYRNNNLIPGDIYQQLTQYKSALGKLSINSSSKIQHLGGEIADELLAAMEASTPQAQVEAFRVLKDQYKNLRLLEPIINSAGPSGILDPKKIAGLMSKQATRQPVGGLKTLAQAVGALPKPLPSGLANAPSLKAKIAIGAGLTGVGAGEAYLAVNDPELAAKAAALGVIGYGIKRGVGAGLVSNWFRNLTVGGAPIGVNPLVPAISAGRAESQSR